MKYAPLLALGFIVSLGAAPALAQMGTGGVGNAMGGPAPTPFSSRYNHASSSATA